MHVVCCTGEEGRNGTNEKTSCKCVSRTESIACRASDQTDEQSGHQSNDVRIADLIRRQVKVCFDDVVEQRWEGVPGK
jgi:hypothetical protein